MTNKDTYKQKNPKSGLTIPELLTVMVVIVLLLSILVPVLARVKSHAHEEIVCRANLRQVGITVQMYLQENDFTMPDCHVIRLSSGSNRHLWTTDGRESSPRLSPDDNSYWGTAYNKYVKDINIFRCPAMRQFLETSGIQLYGGYLHPSVDPNDVTEQASFGLNGYIDQLNANSVINQGEVVVCTDHIEPRNEQGNHASNGDMFCKGSDRHWNLSHYRPGSSSPERTLFYRGIFRHNIRKDDEFETGGRASALWLDGHVSTIEETTGENIPNRWYDPRGIDNGGWLDISQ